MWSKNSRYFLTLLTFIVISLVYLCFLPYRNFADHFNADGSIPVIMAQNPVKSIYSFYYYGQNRFGAYPFLFIFLVSKTFNFTATANSVYFFAFAYFIIALIAMLKSLKVNISLILSLFIFFSLYFHKFTNGYFSIALPYIWQFGSLFLYVNFFIKSLQNKKIIGRIFYIIAILFAFLTVSSNPISMVYLVSISPMFYILHGINLNKFNRNKTLVYYFLSFLPVYALEEIIKVFYNHSNQYYFGKNFSNPLERIELKHILTHTIEQAMRLFSPIWCFIVISTLFINLFLFKVHRKINYPALVFLFLAMLNFFLCILSQYAFSNEYPIRYFMPTYCFLLLAFSFSIANFISTFHNKYNLLQISLTLCLVIISFSYLASTEYNPLVTKKHWEANTIAQLYPRTILWGNYWDVYLYRGLQTNLKTASYPVPTNNDYNRTLWDLCRLKVGENVIVASNSPTTSFEDYGFKFELREDKRLTDLHLPFQNYKIISGKRNFYDKMCENN